MTTATRKLALVTGSATGIGRACALRFAENGFDVVVNYSKSETEARETLQLVEGCHVRGLLVKCDVGDDQAVREMFRQVEAEFGRLDVLVNNAACTWFIDHRNLEELTEDKWDRILQVNLKGRKRIEQYCDYIDDGKFTEATGHDFPTLLFICPGYASLIYLKKHIARIYEETSLDQIEIYIATKEQAFTGSWEKIEAEVDL